MRLDIYPDGGMARLRLWGTLSPAGREAVTIRWYDALPAGFARTLLTSEAALGPDDAATAVAARPARNADGLPAGLREAVAL